MKRTIQEVLSSLRVWRTPCTKSVAKRLVKHFRPKKQLPDIGSERLLRGEWGDGLAIENNDGTFCIRDDSKPTMA